MNKLKLPIRNSELDGLSDSIIRNFRADEKAMNDAFLESSIKELESLSSEITSAILKSKTLSNLDTADNVRDDAIWTLGKLLSAYAVFPIAAKKEFSAPLKEIYDRYARAGITGESYASESALIESMLQDFGADSLSENIKALEGVAEAIASIRSAQDEFIRANDEYVRSCTDKSDSATSLNKPIVRIVNEKLVPYLNAMVISGNGDCIAFAKTVEAEINRTNEMISKRGKKVSA